MNLVIHNKYRQRLNTLHLIMMFPKQSRATLAVVILLFSCCFNSIYCTDSNTFTTSYITDQQHHQKREPSSTQLRRKRPVVRVKASRRHRRLRYRARDPLERLERDGTIIFTRKKDKKDKEVKYVPDDKDEVPVEVPVDNECKWKACSIKFSRISWAKKCSWRKCRGCRKCKSIDGNGPAPSPTTSSDTSMCSSWCHRHRASNERKCTFKECGGCDFCPNTEKETSNGPNDRDRDQPQPRTLCDGISVTFFDNHEVLHDLAEDICLSEIDVDSCRLDCSCCTSYYWWGFDIDDPSTYPDCCKYTY